MRAEGVVVVQHNRDRKSHACGEMQSAARVKQRRGAFGCSAFGILTTLKSRAQRVGIQLPRARCKKRVQKAYDLAREAVSCNAVLAGG